MAALDLLLLLDACFLCLRFLGLFSVIESATLRDELMLRLPRELMPRAAKK